MTSLDDVRRLGGAENGLAILSTTRADGSVQASLINAGVVPHPLTGQDMVGLVALGGALKLRLLRSRPQATITFRAAWQFATVEGRAQLCGPDDPMAGVDSDGLRQLLRDIFTAAGGVHDDWDTYDKVMTEERRAAVLIHPERIYGR